MTDHAPVIAIDGPVGSGKGTIARQVADALGWHLLDSGALYRLLALAARKQGVPLDDAPALAAMAGELDIRFGSDATGEEQIWLAGEDVTRMIRTEECGAGASAVAALPPVREALLGLQRDFRRAPGLVADGRDMGTAVFPDAGLKVFLDASPDIRAKRRFRQLEEKGQSVDYDELLQNIRERDQRDRTRAASPLIPAEDAVYLDSSDLSIDEVLERVLALAAGTSG